MISVYVCSSETSAGKTSISVGLGRRIARDIGKAGYIKPVSSSGEVINGSPMDQDALLAKQALGLDEGPDVLAPVKLSSDQMGDVVGPLQPELAQRVKDSLACIARDKAVVIAEGPRAITDGAQVGLPAHKVVEMLGARALMVIRYRGDATVSNVEEAAAVLPGKPAGAIVNIVPPEQLAYVRDSIVPALESKGIPVMGILPLDRTLLGASVAELVDYLGGSVLGSYRNLDNVIENVMIGARSFSTGLPYFQRRSNKAVVTGADKPDIQLAALETPTACIIVTGNKDPNPLVVRRAQEVKVPLVKVTEGTLPTVERIEQFLSNVRFRQAQKIRGMERLIEDNLDLGKLYAAFGISGR
ncbi:MAG: DRTGG domain-containing protein [Chloroflexi bacterium]|nr:DRTGG domain-containing protein [Chloroflexota bacterium]MDA8188192.1 DRTGG domain-containing protein [Dehalococcoidales bacterium]